MALYDDQKLIKRAASLDQKGYSRRAIAEKLGVSQCTVRKLLDPDYAASERERLRAVDEARAPRWDDPNYRSYQTAYGATPKRLAQVRLAMQRRRNKGDGS